MTGQRDIRGKNSFMNGYLLDTWAWVDYFEGGSSAEEVNKAIEGETKCYTSVQSIAELSDLFYQGSIQIDMNWKEFRQFITAKKTESLPVTEKIAEEAGKIKREERKHKPDFGLADAVILATAHKNNLTLLSGDPHLTDKEISKDVSQN